MRGREIKRAMLRDLRDHLAGSLHCTDEMTGLKGVRSRSHSHLVTVRMETEIPSFRTVPVFTTLHCCDHLYPPSQSALGRG